MAPTETSLAVLDALTAAFGGAISVQVFDTEGQLRRRGGPADEIRVERTAHGLAVAAPAGRTAVQRALGRLGWTAIVSFDTPREAALLPLLDRLFGMVRDKEQVEGDLDSIHSSSLALLEEVALVGDTLPQLPTGRSVVDVAEMGLRALVVAASVRRALFVEFHQATGRCEVLVQVGMDRIGRQAVPIPYAGERLLGAGGLAWETVHGRGDAVLRNVPAGARLGAAGSPEFLAERQIIAVPVTYGGEDKRVVLGVLLVMDKCANAYSDSTELGSHETKLATALASMLGSVLGTRKVAELGNELQMANEIQQQILPPRPAAVPGYQLAGRCSNSGAVGGDYFDYLPMADDRTLVVVADVAGHDLASGMLMVGARSTLRALASKQSDLRQLFEDLAQSLYHDLTRTERFITAVGVVLRPGNPIVDLANAGHNDAIVVRARTGAIERLSSESPVLGFLPAPDHPVRRARLEEGDVLLLYTDGVVEAAAPSGEMLGEDRLAEVVRAAAPQSAASILAEVFAAVEAFAGTRERGDDVTAVAIKAVGPWQGGA